MQLHGVTQETIVLHEMYIEAVSVPLDHVFVQVQKGLLELLVVLAFTDPLGHYLLDFLSDAISHVLLLTQIVKH